MQKKGIHFEESIAHQLLLIEDKYASFPSLAIGDDVLTYGELFALAKQLASHLSFSRADCCLILSRRNKVAYVGLLGAILAGKAYIFLNIKESSSQITQSILLSKSNLLIVDGDSDAVLDQLDNALLQTLFIIKLGDDATVGGHMGVYHAPKEVYPYAYLMFTSGSTGKPKGVPISHVNLNSFVKNICARIQANAGDKFSHINELTFDFSVFEIFCCWLSGACLCVLPDNYIYGIDNYIKHHQITHWSSVPSIVSLLKRLKKLHKNNFESIRYSIFCGEALTRSQVEAWRFSSPHSVIDNLYGPTEATVAITGYVWNENDVDEVVPIGQPFPGQGVYLVDTSGVLVEAGEVGEMYLYGNQVADAYWDSPDASRLSFVTFNGKAVYKTGDLAVLDAKKGLVFKGRRDHQLKLHGYRVEKIEIETRIKTLLKTQAVAIVALKGKPADRVNTLICFLSDTLISIDVAQKKCRSALPFFMIPDEFIKINQFPYNKNGKLDYQALMRHRREEVV